MEVFIGWIGLLVLLLYFVSEVKCLKLDLLFYGDFLEDLYCCVEKFIYVFKINNIKGV